VKTRWPSKISEITTECYSQQMVENSRKKQVKICFPLDKIQNNFIQYFKEKVSINLLNAAVSGSFGTQM
jgi:hypothetical protein